MYFDPKLTITELKQLWKVSKKVEVGFPDVSWVSMLHARLGLKDGAKLRISFKVCSKTNVYFDMGDKKSFLGKKFEGNPYIALLHRLTQDMTVTH